MKWNQLLHSEDRLSPRLFAFIYYLVDSRINKDDPRINYIIISQGKQTSDTYIIISQGKQTSDTLKKQGKTSIVKKLWAKMQLKEPKPRHIKWNY